ncbi:MAG: T9SS type A sorting domain-containing protein [Nitritalea sp.]
MTRVLLYLGIFLLVQGEYAHGQSSSTKVPLAGKVYASSESELRPAALLVDGDLSSSWQSTAPFPDAFYASERQNSLLKADWTAPAGLNLNLALDGNLQSFTPNIPVSEGLAEVRFTFPVPETIHRLGIRLRNVSQPVHVHLQDAQGNTLQTLTYAASQNFQHLRFSPEQAGVTTLLLSSSASFGIFEIGTTAGLLTEFVGIELTEDQLVTSVELKHFPGSGSASASALYGGLDREHLNLLQALDPNYPGTVTVDLAEPTLLRFIEIRHTVLPENWRRVSAFHLQAFAESSDTSASDGDSGTGQSPDFPSHWDPYAGVYPSLSSTSTASASSTVNLQTNAPDLIIDEDFSSSWISSNPLPDRYASANHQNVLLHLFGFASGNVPVQAATDGAWGIRTATIPVDSQAGLAWYELSVPETSIRGLNARFANHTAPIFIRLNTADARDTTLVYPVGGSPNRHFMPQLAGVTDIRITSAAPFIIHEIAAYSQPLREYVTLDLGELKEVSWVRSRHFNGVGNVLGSYLEVGQDSTDMRQVATLNPSAIHYESIRFDSALSIRYVRVVHEIVDENFKKASVQELTVYDAFGAFGPPPQAKRQQHSFSDLLGINTVWAWGTNRIPSLQGPEEGAQKFIRAGRNARNYHNLHWDTADPDETPSYTRGDVRVLRGWTQWLREYADWQEKGFTVNATYTFDRFQETAWNTPYASAAALGTAFASVFGPSHENLVQTVEIGNEPWDYSDSTYVAILEGMSKAMKTADPHLKVLPAALQASNPFMGNTGVSKNFMGYKLSPRAAPYLDGVNIHVYSYTRDAAGNRIAVHPEHPESGMRNLFAGIRFRDHNMPGKEIHVTEWGWDASSLNEQAVNTEAVSEQAQALYALRGLFWLSRMGVDRADWFFYANVPMEDGGTPINYDRSGLTESRLFGFREKLAFKAMERMQNLMGDLYFHGIVEESEHAYIYVLANTAGEPSHLLAWRPVPGDQLEELEHAFFYPYAAQEAFRISGQSTDLEPITLDIQEGEFRLPLSAAPLLVPLLPMQQTLADQALRLEVSQKEGLKAVLRLQTKQPLEQLGEVELAGGFQQAQLLADAEKHWQRQDPHTWILELDEMPLGWHQTTAVLKQYQLESNRVEVEIKGQASLFPNPAREVSHLVFRSAIRGGVDVYVHDTQGRLRQSFSIAPGLSRLELSLMDLKAGVYIMSVDFGAYTERIRFIKQ